MLAGEAQEGADLGRFQLRRFLLHHLADHDVRDLEVEHLQHERLDEREVALRSRRHGRRDPRLHGIHAERTAERVDHGGQRARVQGVLLDLREVGQQGVEPSADTLAARSGAGLGGRLEDQRLVRALLGLGHHAPAETAADRCRPSRSAHRG